MRVIYLLFIWGTLLLIFLSYPRNWEERNIVREVYLKEYYSRILENLLEVNWKEIENLSKDISEHGCFDSKTLSNLEEIRKVYLFYKRDFNVTFGIEVSNSSVPIDKCSYYIPEDGTCGCIYKEFKDPLRRDEKIKVETARIIKKDLERKIEISNKTIVLKSISLGYYK